jgi:hypothetical protein
MSKTMRSIATALAIAASAMVLSSPAIAQASPVIGSWATVAATPMGDFKATMTFAKTNDGYTVDIKDVPMAGSGAPPPGAAPPENKTSDVVVDGNTFSFKRSLVTPQGPLDLTYTGKVDGDTLTGEANSSFGPVPISGKRTPTS